MGPEFYVIIGVAIIVLLIVLFSRKKSGTSSSDGLLKYEQTVDSLISMGKLKSCLRECAIEAYKKEQGYPDALTDEEMAEELYALLDSGELTQEEVDEFLYLYSKSTSKNK